jgi:hypothetical protein
LDQDLARARLSQLKLFNRQGLTLGKGGLRAHCIQDGGSDFHDDPVSKSQLAE